MTGIPSPSHNTVLFLIISNIFRYKQYPSKLRFNTDDKTHRNDNILGKQDRNIS